MEEKDYYQILGVSRDADAQTIKKAFRILARRHHPDVNGSDPQAGQKFKEVNEAYAVLSDPEKRRKYDQFGVRWRQIDQAGGFDWTGWADSQGTAGGRRSADGQAGPPPLEPIFEADEGSLADILEQLFGGAQRSSTPRHPHSRVYTTETASGPAQTIPVDVSLEEAFRGTTRTVRQGNTRFEVTIPPGVSNGSKVHVRTDQEPGLSGDLYLTVQVRPHAQFTRADDDLQVRLAVDLYTALLGGEAMAPTLERPVALAIPAGTQNGRLFRLKGLGMPNVRNPRQRGNLLVEIHVQLPEGLSEREKQLFEQLRSLRR